MNPIEDFNRGERKFKDFATEDQRIILGVVKRAMETDKLARLIAEKYNYDIDVVRYCMSEIKRLDQITKFII